MPAKTPSSPVYATVRRKGPSTRGSLTNLTANNDYASLDLDSEIDNSPEGTPFGSRPDNGQKKEYPKNNAGEGYINHSFVSDLEMAEI